MVMSKKKKGRKIENQTLTTLIKSQTLITEQIRTRQTHIKSPIQTLKQTKIDQTTDRINHMVGETETNVKMSPL